MRQLITRVDDELHERLKARAAAEGRSVNALVVELLSAAVEADPRSAVRRVLARRSRLVIPPVGPRPPSRSAVLRATRGAGSAAGEALDAERSAR
jgi:antitoxin FitA